MVVVRNDAACSAMTPLARSPAIWLLVAVPSGSAVRLVVEMAPSCVPVSAETWVVVKPFTAVVLRPLSAAPPSPRTCVVLSTAVWVVVSAPSVDAPAAFKAKVVRPAMMVVERFPPVLRAAISAPVNPFICTVVREPRDNCTRFVVAIAPSWAPLNADTCWEVKVLAAVVVRLLSAKPFRAAICVVVNAKAWVEERLPSAVTLRLFSAVAVKAGSIVVVS